MHEVETVFARQPMWHGLGNVSGKAVSAAEALQLAGLDWTVEKRPVKYNFGGSQLTDDRHFVTVRSTDGSALGVVGKEFHPIQNTEAFEIVDDLVGEGELLFDSAGSLRHGRVVFVSAKLPDTIEVAGGSDHAELFVVFSHGHDGSKAARVDITPILPVCMNTLTFGQQMAKSHFQTQHRLNARARLADAGRILGLIKDYGAKLSEVSALLAEVEMDIDASKRFITELYSDGVYPSEAVRAKHVDGTLATLENSDRIRPDTRFTAWGNFNAVTEWWDWRRPQRENDTVETRFRATTDGPGKHYRERSLQLLTAR